MVYQNRPFEISDFCTLLFWKQYVRNVGVAADQLLNAITFGSPDETICSRVYKYAMAGVAWAKIGVGLLDEVFGPDHCKSSEEKDEGSDGLL